jgi:hypothetical protein
MAFIKYKFLWVIVDNINGKAQYISKYIAAALCQRLNNKFNIK